MNTARGGLVDEAALALALKDNRCSGCTPEDCSQCTAYLPRIMSLSNIILIKFCYAK